MTPPFYSSYRPNPSSRNGPSGYLVDVPRTLIVSSFFTRDQELANSACMGDLEGADSVKGGKRETRKTLDGLCDDGDGYTVSKLQFGGCRVGFANWGLRASRLISPLRHLLVASSSPSHLSRNSPSSTLLYSNLLDLPALIPTLEPNSRSYASIRLTVNSSRTRDITSSSYWPPLLDPGPYDVALPHRSFAVSSYQCRLVFRKGPFDFVVNVMRILDFGSRASIVDLRRETYKALDGLEDCGDGRAVSKVQSSDSFIDAHCPSSVYYGLGLSSSLPLLLPPSLNNLQSNLLLVTSPRLSPELLSSDSLLLASPSPSVINRVLTVSSTSLPDNRPEPARGHAEPFPENRLGEALIQLGVFNWNHDRSLSSGYDIGGEANFGAWTLGKTLLVAVHQLGVLAFTAQSCSSWSELDNLRLPCR